MHDLTQSDRPSALRSIAKDAMDRPAVGLSERVYDTSKLAALFDMLVNHGYPPHEVLKRVNVTVDEVHSPKTRISLEQLLAACENAIRLSNNPQLPYRVGASVHLSTYGMYGFAILCCPDFRKTMAFAELYHSLAAPLAAIEFREKAGFASWVIEPNTRAAGDPRMYRFITEMQIGIHISLMRDVMGPTFIPDRISLTYPQAEELSLPADEIGCRLSFEEQTNQVVFRSAWLDQDANLGNKTTYPTVVALCDGLLNELKLQVGVAGEISGSSDPGYRQSSDPCGDSKGPRRERSLVAASATGAGRFLPGLAGRTSNAPCDQISAHDKACERGYCAGARL